MRSRVWFRCLAFLVLVAALPWAAGCGLNEYEKKFASEVERIKRFDEADLALGNYLKFPKDVSGGKGPPIFQEQEYIFVRPPQDFSPECTNATSPIAGVLYRYTKKPSGGAAGNMLVPTVAPPGVGFPPPNEKDQGIREIYLAFAMDGKPTAFGQRLLKAFPGAIQEKVRRKVDRVGREPLQFDEWTWMDTYNQAKSEYRIFACQGDSNTMAAVVFRVAEGKAGTAAVRTAITFTLQSLVLGSGAPTLSQNFKPRKEGTKKAST